MNTQEQVLSLIRDNTEEKPLVSIDCDLRQDLRFDSFGTLMLINAIEEQFGVSLDEGDIRQTRTPGDIVALLRSKYHCA